MERFVTFKALAKQLYRQGPRFQAHLKSLQASYLYSPEQLAEFQNRQLRQMIDHCYSNIPYYRGVFDSIGLKPGDIRTPADLAFLPTLDKHLVRENFDQLIDHSKMNFLCRRAQTSGTTGMPGCFIRDYNSINFEHAAVWRHRQWAEATGKRTIKLRGKMIVPMDQANPPFWQLNPLDQELEMCSYHLSPGTAKAYVDKIVSFRPAVLYSAPAIAHMLAKLFRMQGVQYRFEAIVTSSENLAPELASYIQEVFQAPIYDWYGQAERVAAAGTCPAGNTHILEDYSVVELADTPNGSEIIGTQLHNFVMPLLRYRTGDFVVPGKTGCSCGSSFRVIDRMMGRHNTYLITPEGYRIFNTTHIPFGIDSLIETQFFQSRPGEVTIRALTNGNFSEADREELIQRTRLHTSPHMQISLEEVSHIPRGPNGKFISIINLSETANSLPDFNTSPLLAAR